MTKPDHAKHRDRWAYAVVGIVLGLGAPVGWAAWRLAVENRQWLFPWLESELVRHGPLYAYLTIATVAVFALFGYFAGRHGDKIAAETDAVRRTLGEVSQMANTDGLTGLFNTRAMHDEVAQAIESARRYGTAVSCLMVDIDDFKRINDRHGHLAGDIVLKAVADTLRACVRRVDSVGRVGGEEFLVLMPHTTREAAAPVAERIRRAIEGLSFPFGAETERVTVSLGGAHFASSVASDKTTFLDSIDKALYSAKRAGKNRAVWVQ